LDFNKVKIWTITDGSQGMISQVQGLAQNIGKNIINIKVQLFFPWSVLQPGFLPIYKWIFKNNFNIKNQPSIIISCGRRSVYLSLYLKKINKDIINIHIQNPKIDFSKFDFIIAPNHDNIEGKNIIKSIGALHKFTNNNIDNEKINLPDKNLISFIIGGKNNHYKFSEKDILNIISSIKKLKKKYLHFNFIVIASRRTGDKANKILQKNLENVAYVWNGIDKNPYLFALKNSKFFVVTSDSTSMISECAFTGRPIFVYHLPFRRESQRINNFHKEFEKLNITHKFTDDIKLIEWDYTSLDEAKRISGILKKKIIKDFNESK
tara:strand:- start:616 stop:1578 length:963 start_codon:yes stop_codon:yes gene_type:complete